MRRTDPARTPDEADPAGRSGGRLIVVSAPSGAGKTTLCRRVREQMPELVYSVSCTTRSPRPGEVDGRDYHFISKEDFTAGIARRDWAEWAEVHGNYYGTSARVIQEAMAAGKYVLLDIDVQGAEQIRSRFPDCITIFILPPSPEELRRRLESRQSDSPEVIERRLAHASVEMAQRDRYDWVLVNDDLSDAANRLVDYIRRQLGQE